MCQFNNACGIGLAMLMLFAPISILTRIFLNAFVLYLTLTFQAFLDNFAETTKLLIHSKRI